MSAKIPDLNNAVAFVLKGYPRLSETFIAKEILALEERGLDIRLFSLRHPTDKRVHPVHEHIKAPLNYLPEYLYRQPVRLIKAWLAVRRLGGYDGAKRIWLKDLARDLTPNRLRRFGQAIVMACELPAKVGHIHAHFIHTPASVARYAAAILGLPWSCSAHAKDIWTLPEWEKVEKLGDCSWLVSCTEFNARHLAASAPSPERVELLYHGIDFSSFPPPSDQRPARDGSDADDPVLILSVGRTVEKKGYRGLLEALSRIPDGLSWRFIHIGGGTGSDDLEQQAKNLGIEDRVTWMGPQAHETVLENYIAADLFVLASRIADDGDRDGLPNVLMEAQSQGLACLSTRVSGVQELIIGDKTGLLVDPDDIDALTLGLVGLIGNPDLRRALADAGLARVRDKFSHDHWADRLAVKFGLPVAGDGG